VKESFKQTKLYAQWHIFKNKRIINTRETNSSLSEVNVKKYYSFHYESLSSVHSIQAFWETTAYENPKEQLYTIPLSEISLHILNKAIDKVPYFYFNNLKRYFPKLNSTVDFIRNEAYLWWITVEIKTTNASLHHRDIFHKLVDLLESIKNTIRANSSDYIGSTEFFPVKIAEVVTDKKMYIEKPKSSSTAEYWLSMSTESTKVRLNLWSEDCRFYVYDDDYWTDEEKYLVKMIYENLWTFTKDFEQVFLIRNQKIIELYSFDSWRRFEPDYLLFLWQETDKSNYYQLFIEPKWWHIEDWDRRKEDFLKAIWEEQKVINLFEDKKYYIYWLPFYSEENKFEFMEVLNEKVR
jgi:type III restriction enzyme